jgi:hypothetical protein
MKKYFLIFAIPTILFLLGVFLILAEVYQLEGNFFSVRTSISQKNLTYPTGHLLVGNKITGTFKSNFNNLGTVRLRFTTHYRLNEDWVIFRIKNINDNNWYYEGKYKSDQFQPSQLFPFGFPPITNSAGNIYYFEVESNSGTPDNSVSINMQYPIAEADYSFDKHHLLSFIKRTSGSSRQLDGAALKDFLIFIVLKTYSILFLNEYATTVILYLSPIPIYLFWYKVLSTQAPKAIDFLSNNRNLVLATFTLFLFRIFLFKSNSDFMIFLIIVSWLMCLLIYRSFSISKPNSFIMRHRSLSLIVPLLILIKALFIKSNPDFITIIIILLWLTSIIFYKIKNKINIYISLGFLITSAILYTSNITVIAEQTAAWVIVFFGFAVLRDLYSTIANNTFFSPLSRK